MFIDFSFFFTVGVLNLLILIFLMACGLKGVGGAFISILFMTALAFYFGNKNG